MWGERPNTLRTTVNPDSAVLQYVLAGITAHEPTARLLALAYSSVMYDGLFRSKLELADAGVGIWYVTVTYGPKKQPEEGDISWAFDTTGGTKHITESLETISVYKGPQEKAKIPHGKAIGVTDDGDVEGTDIIDKSFKWTENHQLLLASYSWSYSDIVGDLTGTVNDATFRGKPAKTVLFEGAQGTRSTKDPDLLDMTYHFSYSRSATNLTIGEGQWQITGIVKKGWHYLWTRFRTAEGAPAKTTTQVPRQVSVEKVYDEGDFSLLGIGTGTL